MTQYDKLWAEASVIIDHMIREDAKPHYNPYARATDRLVKKLRREGRLEPGKKINRSAIMVALKKLGYAGRSQIAFVYDSPEWRVVKSDLAYMTQRRSGEATQLFISHRHGEGESFEGAYLVDAKLRCRSCKEPLPNAVKWFIRMDQLNEELPVEL